MSDRRNFLRLAAGALASVVVATKAAFSLPSSVDPPVAREWLGWHAVTSERLFTDPNLTASQREMLRYWRQAFRIRHPVVSSASFSIAFWHMRGIILGLDTY